MFLMKRTKNLFVSMKRYAFDSFSLVDCWRKQDLLPIIIAYGWSKDTNLNHLTFWVSMSFR